MAAALFLHSVLGLAVLAPAGDFEVRTGPGVSAATRSHVERLVADGLARLAPKFEGTPTRPFVVWAHRDLDSVPEQVRETLHEGTAGCALLGRSEIHLILDEVQRTPPHDLRTVVDHEIVHVLLDQYAGAAAPYVSRWFHEGLAQVLSGGPYIGMSEEDLVAAVHWNRLIPFADLHEDFPHERSGLRRAYAQSFSFVGFLERELGLETLLEAARRSEPEGGFRTGFVAVTGAPLVEHENEWREYVLTGSGAMFRVVLQNCFAYVMIAAFVLLALAGIRRWRRDDLARAKLEREEQEPPPQ